MCIPTWKNSCVADLFWYYSWENDLSNFLMIIEIWKNYTKDEAEPYFIFVFFLCSVALLFSFFHLNNAHTMQCKIRSEYLMSTLDLLSGEVVFLKYILYVHCSIKWWFNLPGINVKITPLAWLVVAPPPSIWDLFLLSLVFIQDFICSWCFPGISKLMAQLKTSSQSVCLFS